MKKFSYDDCKYTLESRGYKFFDDGDYNINLIGIRSPDKSSNKFNDIFIAALKINGLGQAFNFACTTDPGMYYRLNPVNVHGTAIVVPGQYRGLWKIGKHKGEYKALVQHGPVKVWRDSDKNEIIDRQALVDEGYYGINCHRTAYAKAPLLVDRWSAGCQVLACAQEFDLLMGLCSMADFKYGNSFTYTLIDD